MATFRSILSFLTPSWLYNSDEPLGEDPVHEGSLLFHSLSLLSDAFTRRALEGLESRFPTRAGTAALDLLGDSRGILRGRDETNAHYAARLVSWRYPRGHRVRGGAPALLEQISEYFGGIRCWTIDKSGNRYTREVDGTLTIEHGVTWDWDGEAVTPLWGKFWIGLDPNPDRPLIVRWPTFDGGSWGGLTFEEIVAAGYTLDHQGISAQDAAAIKGLVRGGSLLWRPDHAEPVFLVVRFTDPAVSSFPAPGGAWGTWAGRDSTLGYWCL